MLRQQYFLNTTRFQNGQTQGDFAVSELDRIRNTIQEREESFSREISEVKDENFKQFLLKYKIIHKGKVIESFEYKLREYNRVDDKESMMPEQRKKIFLELFGVDESDFDNLIRLLAIYNNR